MNSQDLTSMQQLRILVVEDDESVLDLYQGALHFGEEEGITPQFDVVVCRQGEEAIEQVKKACQEDRPFSVVFLDLRLPPGANGLWTAEKIRGLDELVNLVIVTGWLEVDPREVALRAPPEDKFLYLQKPFSLYEIRQFALSLGAKWRLERMLKKINEDLEHTIDERTAELECANAKLRTEVNERTLAEEALRKAHDELEERVKERTAQVVNINMELLQSQRALEQHRAELESLNRQLLDANNALSVLARNEERTRKDSEKRIIVRVNTIVIPFIEKLRKDKYLERYRVDLNMLASYIENLTSDLAADVRIAGSLTAAELHIASMIKNGLTTEEIARHLNIAPATVKTHRKRIRKKLSLQDSGLNLRAFLESQLGEESAKPGK
jgi:DNA-binding NarL/FixJ family response regulator